MSWTKRQIINSAYEEIGLASYVFDLSPEQLESALRRLDSMMALWAEKGILVGFPVPESPQNSDITQDTGIADYAAEAIYLNLGLRLAPPVGKVVSAETKAAAKSAFDALAVRFAFPNQQQYSAGLPAGAGAKTWRLQGDPFLPSPDTSPLTTGESGQLTFNGE